MGCNNCNTCAVSEKRGCGTSTVFDWLYQIDGPETNHTNLVEVQFKGDRKEFYNNIDKINISPGDFVAVQGEKSGHDVGRVTIQGELVALQIKRKNLKLEIENLKKVYRKANDNDFVKLNEITEMETKVLKKAKKIVAELNMEMKLSDIEFQADSSKAIFYYTAEKRVDFRELIKIFSKNFKTRIEMRQIGVRQEAAKIGGIGSCGRELCCSTWMTDFPSVTTGAARYQQLSINPQKISGQCGRLKCCLNFELDSYTEALKKFPSTKTRLKTKKGNAKFLKLDVFKNQMSYYYQENPSEIIDLLIQDVNKIIDLNKKGKIPEKIEDFTVLEEELVGFKNASGQDSINRFDKKIKKRPKKR